MERTVLGGAGVGEEEGRDELSPRTVGPGPERARLRGKGLIE